MCPLLRVQSKIINQIYEEGPLFRRLLSDPKCVKEWLLRAFFSGKIKKTTHHNNNVNYKCIYIYMYLYWCLLRWIYVAQSIYTRTSCHNGPRTRNTVTQSQSTIRTDKLHLHLYVQVPWLCTYRVVSCI